MLYSIMSPIISVRICSQDYQSLVEKQGYSVFTEIDLQQFSEADQAWIQELTDENGILEPIDWRGNEFLPDFRHQTSLEGWKDFLIKCKFLKEIRDLKQKTYNTEGQTEILDFFEKLDDDSLIFGSDIFDDLFRYTSKSLTNESLLRYNSLTERLKKIGLEYFKQITQKHLDWISNFGSDSLKQQFEEWKENDLIIEDENTLQYYQKLLENEGFQIIALEFLSIYTTERTKIDLPQGKPMSSMSPAPLLHPCPSLELTKFADMVRGFPVIFLKNPLWGGNLENNNQLNSDENSNLAMVWQFNDLIEGSLVAGVYIPSDMGRFVCVMPNTLDHFLKDETDVLHVALILDIFEDEREVIYVKVSRKDVYNHLPETGWNKIKIASLSHKDSQIEVYLEMIIDLEGKIWSHRYQVFNPSSILPFNCESSHLPSTLPFGFQIVEIEEGYYFGRSYKDTEDDLYIETGGEVDEY